MLEESAMKLFANVSAGHRGQPPASVNPFALAPVRNRWWKRPCRLLGCRWVGLLFNSTVLAVCTPASQSPAFGIWGFFPFFSLPVLVAGMGRVWQRRALLSPGMGSPGRMGQRGAEGSPPPAARGNINNEPFFFLV